MLTQCTILGCIKPRRAMGWCQMHYRRWRRHGDPRVTLTPQLVTGHRPWAFWSKVKFTEACWVWAGSTQRLGYGNFGVKFKSGWRIVPAHRWAYEFCVGPIPDGLTLDHLCRVRNCVNPDHLEPVTLRENILRGENMAARYARRTHCDKGHEFTPENTSFHNGGVRRCKRCRKATRRRVA